MNYVDLMSGKIIDFDSDFPVGLYEDILVKYFDEDKKCNIFEDDIYDGDVEIEKRIYSKYSDEDECGELYFKHKENNDNSFPTGYNRNSRGCPANAWFHGSRNHRCRADRRSWRPDRP